MTGANDVPQNMCNQCCAPSSALPDAENHRPNLGSRNTWNLDVRSLYFHVTSCIEKILTPTTAS